MRDPNVVTTTVDEDLLDDGEVKDDKSTARGDADEGDPMDLNPDMSTMILATNIRRTWNRDWEKFMLELHVKLHEAGHPRSQLLRGRSEYVGSASADLLKV